MSNDDRPEFRALEELEQVLKGLSSEVSSWRKRALKAEGEQAALDAGYDAVANRERILELESRNADLELRLTAARDRMNELLSRIRFLEEQVAIEEQAR